MELGVMSYFSLAVWAVVCIILLRLQKALSYEGIGMRITLIIVAIYCLFGFYSELIKIPPGIASSLASEINISEMVPSQLQKSLYAEAKIRIVLDEEGEVKSIALVRGSTTKPTPIKEDPAQK